MGTHRKTLEEKCRQCGENKIEFSMKNPFIDDFASECPRCNPGSAIDSLHNWSRLAAREEED